MPEFLPISQGPTLPKESVLRYIEPAHWNQKEGRYAYL